MGDGWSRARNVKHERSQYLNSPMRSGRPRGRFRRFFHAPTPEDWLPLEALIREGYDVMLVWDSRAKQWRCDAFHNGEYYHGADLGMGAAIQLAWLDSDQRPNEAPQER